MTASIRVIGSLNVDMVTVTPRFPGPGETITASSFSINPGGKGANQAVACGRMSRKRPDPGVSNASHDDSSSVQVEMLGAVGGLDAHFPKTLAPILHLSGVQSNRVFTVPDDYTGVAVITVDSSAGGENRILFSPGANYSGMKPNPEVMRVLLSTPMPSIIVMQCEMPKETVIEILRGVGKRVLEGTARTQVIFNPAPAPEGIPDDAWAAVDHLVMNETEAELMAPPGIPTSVGEVGSQGRREYIAKHFHSLGVRFVVITLGAAGLWYSAADPGATAQETGKDWLCVTAFVAAIKVQKVIDTTAAGDTFVGAYATRTARLLESNNIATMSTEQRRELYGQTTTETVQWAVKACGLCVQKNGAMDSIPYENEV